MENKTNKIYFRDVNGNEIAKNPIDCGNINVVLADTSVTTTSEINTWDTPTIIEFKEVGNTIEMVYKEISMITYTNYFSKSPEERVFKIVFSCVDGKWNKSDRIYGDIHKSTEETYSFE